jgi:hypothetical protein
MKRVLLRDRGPFRAREVITTILEQPSPGAGVSYADMRKRDRVLDALARFRDQPYADFEDSDYDVLKGLMENFQFGVAKRDLRLILDDIANAKSPEEMLALKLVDDAS